MTLYSHSRLSTFEQCPQKFKFAYIDGLEREEETIEAFMGSRVHEALEKLYQDLRFQKLNSLQEVLDYYNLEWSKNWNENVKIVRSEYSTENFHKMGEKYLQEYYEKHKPFNESKTIGLEEQVFIELADEEGMKYKLQGFIDRLAFKGEGFYEIHDYKTALNLPDQEHFEEDRQLALYSLAIKEKFPDAKKIDLVWHYLAYGKEIRSTRNDLQLTKLKKEVINIIKKIDAAKERNEFKPIVSALCNWCEFREICPAQKHLVKTEKLSSEEFKEDNGVKLVNEYAKLDRKKKELLAEIDPELEKIKIQLINFAKKEGIELVAGSEFQARVKTYLNEKFPSNNEKQLEQLIRSLGFFDEVSVIDSKKLLEVLPLLPKEIQEKINKFKETNEKTYVFISKKKEFNG